MPRAPVPSSEELAVALAMVRDLRRVIVETPGAESGACAAKIEELAGAIFTSAGPCLTPSLRSDLGTLRDTGSQRAGTWRGPSVYAGSNIACSGPIRPDDFMLAGGHAALVGEAPALLDDVAFAIEREIASRETASSPSRAEDWRFPRDLDLSGAACPMRVKDARAVLRIGRSRLHELVSTSADGSLFALLRVHRVGRGYDRRVVEYVAAESKRQREMKRTADEEARREEERTNAETRERIARAKADRSASRRV